MVVTDCYTQLSYSDRWQY